MKHLNLGAFEGFARANVTCDYFVALCKKNTKAQAQGYINNAPPEIQFGGEQICVDVHSFHFENYLHELVHKITNSRRWQYLEKK